MVLYLPFSNNSKRIVFKIVQLVFEIYLALLTNKDSIKNVNHIFLNKIYFKYLSLTFKNREYMLCLKISTLTFERSLD